MIRHAFTGLLFGSALLVLATGCQVEQPAPYTESLVLGGEEVDAATLNNGREAYRLYCYACHGDMGDGRGPASSNLRPAPRDLRTALYKFTYVDEGLPTDEQVLTLLQRGLHGSAMHPWEDVPEVALRNIVKYIKTFSPEGYGWRDEEETIGNPLEAPCDPWSNEDANGNGALDEGEDCNGNNALDGDRLDAAIARGDAQFHGKSNCFQCHAAYSTRDGIAKAAWEFGERVSKFRDNLYYPVTQKSSYSVPIPGHKTAECSEDLECQKLNRHTADRWTCALPTGTCVDGENEDEDCTSDADCGEGWCEGAGTKGTCAECETDMDCGGAPCTEDSECAERYGSDKFQCAEDGYCVECLFGRECPKIGNPCETSPGECNKRVCRYGVCEQMAYIMPRQFEGGVFRNGSSPEAIFLTVRAGIKGTAMPASVESDADVWAIAHYVHHLTQVNRSAEEVTAHKAKLEAAPLTWSAPKPEPAPAEAAPAEAAPAEAAPAEASPSSE